LSLSSESFNSLSDRAFSTDVRDTGVVVPGIVGTVVEEETSEGRHKRGNDKASFPNDRS